MILFDLKFSCLNGHKAEEIEVVAGIVRLDERSASNTFQVASINLPEGYNIDVNVNNTSILKLASKLNLEDNKIEKACIRMFDKTFEKATFQGWGSTRQHKLDIEGKITPTPKPSNKLKKILFIPIDEIKSESKWYLETFAFDEQSSCLMDEGGALHLDENGKTIVVGIADEALLAPDNDHINLAIMCAGKSAFIKFSSIRFFIEKYGSKNMCLIYE